jgi:hypothetical protein
VHNHMQNSANKQHPAYVGGTAAHNSQPSNSFHNSITSQSSSSHPGLQNHDFPRRK